LTVGGWDGSIYFSSSVATSANRTTFVNSIVNMVNTYGFQGVEFEYVHLIDAIILGFDFFCSWEYPGSTNGLECNTESPQDTANFLLMLQELKQQSPNVSLSAAVPVKPWNDAIGNPSTDLTSFAQVLDYIGERLIHRHSVQWAHLLQKS